MKLRSNFLSSCKVLGTIILITLFYFHYHLSTSSYFTFSSFEHVTIILENYSIIFNPIQRIRKANAPIRRVGFSSLQKGRPSILETKVSTMWSWHKIAFQAILFPFYCSRWFRSDIIHYSSYSGYFVYHSVGEGLH